MSKRRKPNPNFLRASTLNEKELTPDPLSQLQTPENRNSSRLLAISRGSNDVVGKSKFSGVDTSIEIKTDSKNFNINDF